MQRREGIESFSSFVAKATGQSSRLDPRTGLFGFLGIILIALAGAPNLFAEPSEVLDEALPSVSAPPPASAIFLVDGPADHEDWSDSAPVEQYGIEDGRDAAKGAGEGGHAPIPADESSVAALEELLYMRIFGESAWKPATLDEALAVAVANRASPDIKSRSAFRKRSRDLFRTDFRQVKIGRAEMLMRLRLRAKSRNAISVEVRF